MLKGCEQWFQPEHPLSRYCGSACQAGARTWRQCESNRRYRASEQGKSQRREQGARYRQRLRERKSAAAVVAESAAGLEATEPELNGSEPEAEGYPKTCSGKNFRCRRPGCYERFARTGRSPRQAFCSPLCYHALRRVLIRERRWKERLGIPLSRDPAAVDDG